MGDEHFKDGGGEIVSEMSGLSMDSEGVNFDYLIAGNYLSWKDIPNGYKTRITIRRDLSCVALKDEEFVGYQYADVEGKEWVAKL